MKTKYIVLLLSAIATFTGCAKSDSYPGAQVSPYISIFDIRNIYKNDSVVLNTAKMSGADSITGVVVTDHSENNLPEGLLMIQDYRRLSSLRGIALIAANAADYKVGDSIIVNVNGHTLKRQDGLLEITGIAKEEIRKISSNNTIAVNRVSTAALLATPDIYQSTQISIVKGGPNPLPSSPIAIGGAHVINDGFGDITLQTESTANFASNTIPVLANYTGVVMSSLDAKNQIIPYVRIRTNSDITILSSQINIVPIVITGYLCDPSGSDANYEYVQLIATQDVDFSQTPYSVVTTNNAGTSTPTGYPTNGWATGGLRTYKINLTSGTVKKGTYFYVGGTNKNINGSGSTSMASSNWFGYPYNTTAGQGFGTATTNLLGNSGNAAGIALFNGTTVTVDSEPVDIVMISNGGSLYRAGSPTVGYKITNTDFYDKVDPIKLTVQPYFLAGTNTLYFAYNPSYSPGGLFSKLGGKYNVSLGRWTTARAKIIDTLTTSSSVSILEDALATKLVN